MKFTSYLFLYLISLGTVFSQSQIDTLQANRSITLGDSLLKSGNYREAVTNYTQAAQIFEKFEIPDRMAASYNGVSESSWRLGDRATGEEMALKAVDICSTYLSEKHLEMGNAYFNLGIIYLQRGELTKARKYQKDALNIRLENLGHNNSITAKSYNILGILFDQEYKLDSALFYYEKALEVGLEILGEDDPSIGNYYDNIGIIYNRKGDFDQALSFKQKALEVRKRTLPENHPALASSYQNIGAEYEYRSNFELASDYHQKALKIRETFLNKTHPFLASSYLSIAHLEMTIGNYEQALEYSLKGADLNVQNFGNTHSGVAISYAITSKILRKKGEDERSLEYIQKALNIQEDLFGENHPNTTEYRREIAALYWKLDEYEKALKYCEENMLIFKKENTLDTEMASRDYVVQGMIHKSLGDHEKAASILKKAVELSENAYGSVDGHVAWQRLELGEAYVSLEDYEQGLSIIQSALMANSPGFRDTDIYQNPDIDNYLDATVLSGSLLSKAEVLEKWHERTQDLKDLTFSLETLELIDQLFDKLKARRARIEDKLDALDQITQVYQSAIRVSLKLHEVTGEAKYLEKCFFFAEKSRSNTLSLELSVKNAKKFAGIPDSLWTVENSLKSDRSFFQSKILALEAKGESADITKIDGFRDQLRKTNAQLDSLTLLFESEFPNYFDLKYKNTTFSVTEIQDKLSDDEALLEYFVGSNGTYIFSLTKDSYTVHELKKDSLPVAIVNNFIESLDPETTLSDKQVYDQFAASASVLYEKLMAPPLANIPNSINQLTIIPDRLLSSIPWDIFLMEKPSDTLSIDYKNLDYLFQKFIIDYGFSASILFRDQAEKNGNGLMLAFASSYDEYSLDSYSSFPSQFRSELVPLTWNTSEVSDITSYISGETFIGKEANEKLFKEKAEEYDILHLAMHAFVDHKDPPNSRLMFTATNDSIEDDMLHAFELFNMDLSAKMVVLSACETGIGEFKDGEGVLSLGKAFAYAGSPSIVMSHWNVDDQSTSQLMSLFYKGLSEGKPKDVALRDARIKFLEESSEITQKPIYWGSFIVMGDDSPIEDNWLSPLVRNLIIIGLIGFVIILYFQNKARRKKKLPSMP